MIFDVLDDIRSRPKEVRKRYVLTITTTVTGVIVVLWLSVLFFGSEPAVEIEQVETVEQVTAWDRLKAVFVRTDEEDVAGAETLPDQEVGAAPDGVVPVPESQFHFVNEFNPGSSAFGDGASSSVATSSASTTGAVSEVPAAAPVPESPPAQSSGDRAFVDSGIEEASTP